jgi:transcriptional regulator with XRE-family HTH domain
MTTSEGKAPASPLAFGIASALSDARRERRVTQTKLAELSGVPAYQISRFEGAWTDVSVSDLLALCDALGVDFKLFLETARQRAAEYEQRGQLPTTATVTRSVPEPPRQGASSTRTTPGHRGQGRP